MSELLDLFQERCKRIKEDEILSLSKGDSSGGLNNVVVGRHKHCFAILMMSDKEPIEYQLLYVSGRTKLEGFILELSMDLPDRDNLVFLFSEFLSHEYDDLDLVDVLNTFQEKTRTLFEVLGFMTISSIDLDKIADPNPLIMAKGVKGIIRINEIEKATFYRSFFGNKKMSDWTTGEDHVYIMLNTRNNYFKIGRSNKPKFREKTLQADEPEVEMITFWKAPAQIEKELHKVFSAKRMRGEWFDLTFQELKSIKDRMESYE